MESGSDFRTSHDARCAELSVKRATGWSNTTESSAERTIPNWNSRTAHLAKCGLCFPLICLTRSPLLRVHSGRFHVSSQQPPPYRVAYIHNQVVLHLPIPHSCFSFIKLVGISSAQMTCVNISDSHLKIIIGYTSAPFPPFACRRYNRMPS